MWHKWVDLNILVDPEVYCSIGTSVSLGLSSSSSQLPVGALVAFSCPIVLVEYHGMLVLVLICSICVGYSAC